MANWRRWSAICWGKSSWCRNRSIPSLAPWGVKIDALELRLDTKIDALEQKFDARLERLDLRQGADMKRVYWMMSTLILLNLGILSKLMLQ